MRILVRKATFPIMLFLCVIVQGCSPTQANGLVSTKPATNAVKTTTTASPTGPVKDPSKEGTPVPPPEGFGFDGTILIENQNGQWYDTVGGMPLVYSRLNLPGPQDASDPTSIFGFSPDGEWLAYAPLSFSSVDIIGGILDQWRIGLLSSNGKVIEHEFDMSGFASEMPEDAILAGWGPGQWVNNTILHISLGYRYRDILQMDSLYTYLDPFKGEWRESLVEGLPGLLKNDSAYFSPDLSHVLYISGQSLSLWNIPLKGEVWEGPNVNSHYGFTAKWSPDNRRVAYQSYPTHYLSIIYLGGANNLIETFTLPESKNTSIHDYVWSTDGKYLAMTIIDSVTNEGSVAVYDIASSTYIFSYPWYKSEDSVTGLTGFYWSPDSRYIAYSYYLDDKPKAVVIDLENKLSVELPIDGTIRGWSDKFPVRQP